jgi:vacuolar-type H+-ATPase catalytic subunit A/Vma1
MSDDLTEKIQQLKDMLNNDQLPDNLKNMMNLLSNNDKTQSVDNNTGIDNLLDNQAMIMKIKKIMDNKNQINDPRITLLNALKPYLCQKRQSRIDSCSSLLNFIQILSFLKEDD